MELDYKKYNLDKINNGEELFGYVEDILNYYKDYTKELLDFLKYEDFYSNIVEIMKLIDNLSKLNKDYIAMVGYDYKENEYKIGWFKEIY